MKENKFLSWLQVPAVKKIATWTLLVIVLALVYVNVASIMAPVKFNKAKDARSLVAIERLKDIRTLQEAYKSVHGEYTESIDSLIDFYNTGDIIVKLQIGSKDDSLAYEHTRQIKQQRFWLRGDALNRALYELYLEGDKNLVFTVDNKIPTRDTLFNGRPGFCIDSLRTIPFSGGQSVQMEAVVKTVSGVKVPLFEARMPYRALLNGLDNQLRINLDAEMENKNHYVGLQVGSVTAPNNNAGNWE